MHVFIFSATFPLFNIVDELCHFDLVVKYSQNHVPRGLDSFSKESLDYIVLYSTIEYCEDPTNFPDGRIPPPPWTQPMDQIRQALQAEEQMGSGKFNYEATQPPLYYELAGIWWRLGKVCGIHDGYLPYWLRFLNILVVCGLVWLGHWAARLVFPERPFVRLAVPALIAFMSQSVFYSISNDVLSPVCYGLAFIALLYFWHAETPDIRLGIFTGLALAAALLDKMTNLPMYAVSIGFIFWKIRELAKARKLRPALPSFAALFICAGIPAAIWMAWCKSVYGDFTGSHLKADNYGWTLKPAAEWLHHPIFTPGGFWTFLSGNLSTFWQGEMIWHNKPMVLPGTGVFFTVFSLVALAAALPALLPRSSNTIQLQRQALRLGLGGFVAGLAFSALLSVMYDFHDFYYPSRAFPYFTSGRLLLGSLIPVMLLLACGWDRLLDCYGNRVKFLTLVAFISAMIIVEVATDWSIFPNAYNWFHLP